MSQVFTNQTYDEERALYGLDGAVVEKCLFAGPRDGESPLKETKNISVKDCRFELRYPFWHVTNGTIDSTTLTDTCRAALWYTKNVSITDSTLGGIKALRECDNTTLTNVTAISDEFGWRCRGISVNGLTLTSMYPFFECTDVSAENLTMTAKYSFQYAENVTIRNSKLKTKDAFWHSKNVTVYDSVVEGEYLAWYSENLRLVRCRIIGTQPLCYCRGLVLEDCEMIDCDFSFEKSEVTATVKGKIDSVKNPLAGSVSADGIGEIILDDPEALLGKCEIKQKV